MVGPEHAIPILPSHAGSAVTGPRPVEHIRPRSPSPSERVRPRSPHSLSGLEDERTMELRGRFLHSESPRIIQPVRVPPTPPVITPRPQVVLPPVMPPPALRVVPSVPVTLPGPRAVRVVPAWPDSRNSRLEDAEQERQNRFEELVGVLDRMIVDLQKGEEKREENYRANEEERERVFIENERRRDIEAEQRHEAMLKEPEDHLAVFKSRPAAAIPAGSESSTRVPPGGGSLEPSLREAAASRHWHAASAHEVIRLEREAAQAERERAQGLEQAVRDQVRAEHQAHICALENELGAVRKELADEKMARAAEEAARHERKRAEMLAQNDMMRNQLGDIIGLLLERRDTKALRGDDNKRWQGGSIGLRFGYVCLSVCVCSMFLVAVFG
ncbi:hypothetical protein V8D89_013345 [Ganoderma adspersum]